MTLINNFTLARARGDTALSSSVIYMGEREKERERERGRNHSTARVPDRKSYRKFRYKKIKRHCKTCDHLSCLAAHQINHQKSSSDERSRLEGRRCCVRTGDAGHAEGGARGAH